MKSITFDPGARRDLRQVVKFYEEQQSGLGNRVVLAVREAILQVAEYPGAAVRVDDTLRRTLVRKFSIHVYFRVTGDELEVLVIEDARRDPAMIEAKLAVRSSEQGEGD